MGSVAPYYSVEAATAAGQDVLLVIDVQGAAHHRSAGLDAVDVFVLPPSWEVLAQPWTRGSESERQAQRLLVARQEPNTTLRMTTS